MDKSWKIDVPVVINFFVRPAIFERTFECIREARPRILFLVSDGPRKEVSTDLENVNRCRKIAENID